MIRKDAGLAPDVTRLPRMLDRMLRAWMVVVVVMLGARSVRAAPDRDRTQAAMTEYFDGEMRGGFVLVGMGAAGLLAGGLMVRSGNATATGAAYPLLGIGVLHVAAGIFVYASSAKRVGTFSIRSRPIRVRSSPPSARA
jgi:hypothetical protein